jgi:uncharacterized membrane protein YkoI
VGRIIAAGTAAAALGFTAYTPAADATPWNFQFNSWSSLFSRIQTSTKQAIGADKAKEIAFASAGATAADANMVRAQQEYDDGRLVYEIEFYVGNVEWDFEIDAYNGAIRERDRDIERFVIPTYVPPSTPATPVDPTPTTPTEPATPAQPATPATPTTPSVTTYIGVDAAKDIAFKHSGIDTTKIAWQRANQSRDDGRVVYDVEFYILNPAGTAYIEYDYEIDAITGKIREVDRDIEGIRPTVPKPSTPVVVQPTTPTTPAATYVGTDKAKSVALAKAGLTASQVRGLKAELDRERNGVFYEVEFKYGRYEYEFQINATTGAIVRWDREYDD